MGWLKKTVKSVTKTVTKPVKQATKVVKSTAKAVKTAVVGKTVTVGQPFSSQIVSWSLSALKSASTSMKLSPSQRSAIRDEIKRREELSKTAAYTTKQQTLINNQVKMINNFNTTNKKGYNLTTSDDTAESIKADETIVGNIEKVYKNVDALQCDLEKQVVSYTFPSLNSISSSGGAEKAIQSVDKQIERLKALKASSTQINTVLNKEKSVLQSQLKQRQAEAKKIEDALKTLNTKIQEKQKAAQAEVDAKTKELNEQFNAGKITKAEVSSEIQNVINKYSGEVDQLFSQVEMKQTQLNMVNKAITSINKNIKTIDNRLTKQKTKVAEYDKQLSAANQYKAGLQKVKTAAQQQESKKVKKGGLVNGIANFVKDGIKTVVNGVKKIVSGSLKFVGDTVKSVCKVVGKGIDKAGLDTLGNNIKKTGAYSEGTFNTVAGIVTANKKDISTGWKQMKENAVAAATTAITVVAAVASAGAGAGVAGAIGGSVASSTAGSVAVNATANVVVSAAVSETVKRETGNETIAAVAGSVTGNVAGGAASAASIGTSAAISGSVGAAQDLHVVDLES